MEWLNLLMRWLHLVSVAVLIGSAAFVVLVLRPALAAQSPESRRDFFLSLKIRLKMLVHGSIAGILVSGLYNTHLGWKTALAPNLGVFLTKVSGWPWRCWRSSSWPLPGVPPAPTRSPREAAG